MSSEKVTRRRVLTVMAGGTVLATIALPSNWTKPIVESVIVPAHAVGSLPLVTTTTTSAPTTTAAPTSTTPSPTTTGN